MVLWLHKKDSFIPSLGEDEHIQRSSWFCKSVKSSKSIDLMYWNDIQYLYYSTILSTGRELYRNSMGTVWLMYGECMKKWNMVFNWIQHTSMRKGSLCKTCVFLQNCIISIILSSCRFRNRIRVLMSFVLVWGCRWEL